MLSFRLVLVSIAAGICLSGLFNLLDNLKQPELLRSAKAVIVKGCEPAESAEAEHLCPQLYCQKALIEARLVPLRTRFTVTIDKQDPNTAPMGHLIAGTVANSEGGDPAFACLLQGNKVNAFRRMTTAEIAALSAEGLGHGARDLSQK